MFYVEVKRPVDLKEENHKLYAKISKEYGIKYGIHLVKEGLINGEKGAARFREY